MSSDSEKESSGTSVAAQSKDCDGSSYRMANKGKGILKRKFSPDSPDASSPRNFIGVSWISKYIWGVNIKSILPGPNEQKKGN